MPIQPLRVAQYALRAALPLVFASFGLGATGCALVARIPAEPAGMPGAAVGAPQPAAPPAAAGTINLPNVADIAAQVRPAVVAISTRSVGIGAFLNPIQEEGTGSGFVYDPRGYIATNDHVIRGAREIQVTLPDGRTFTNVRVVGQDPRTDLAVLKIEGANLPVAQLGDSDHLRVGDWVVAIGNALGLEGGPTVTAGVVGALGRSIQEPNGVILEDLIQTDAAINPGNSGGPLVDTAGRVVGINTAIDTRGQGIGFAISINGARAIFDELVERGRVVRGVMGVNVATLTPASAARLGISQTQGAIIVNVLPGSPADRAGLRPGDVIAAVDGRDVRTTRDLLRYLAGKKPGEQVTVRVQRGRDERAVTITLEESRS